MQKETENKKEDRWKTIKAKGKKKIGECEDGVLGGESSFQDLPNQQAQSSQQVHSDDSLQVLPSPKDIIIPSVSQEAPLKVTSPRASQIIEEVEREVLAAKSPIVCNSPPTSSGSKKKKPAGKSSGSQRKKYKGLNDPLKQREIRDFVFKEDLKILSILETKVKYANEQTIFGKLVDLASQTSKIPSVWMGDFNAIRSPFEKIGGSKKWSMAKELGCQTNKLMAIILLQKLIEF
ncbi:hypothetical protein CsSME_00037815 [Camellia sinensis var. sinensis]